MRTSFVYLIGCEDGGPVKIGHASNARQRLHTLQIGHWQELKLLHTVTVPCTIAQAVEAAMHARFDSCRVRGEWFAAPLDMLRSSLDKTAETFIAERGYGDRLSTNVCVALCKQPTKTMAVISAYRNRANDLTSKAFIEAVNTKLYREAGQAAYLMFKMVFVENRDMTTRFANQSKVARQAEASLIKALDCLTSFWEHAEGQWRTVDIRARTAA